MSSRMCILPFALAITFTSVAHASEGVLEINQACAVETGCFTDDAPGFPVGITDNTPGKSFRLTSDLIVNSPSDGIVIASDFVEIDLNGFRIVQAGCETATSMCNTVAGFSEGIVIAIGAMESTVRNGSVVGMNSTGIHIGERGRIENVTVKWSGREGIRAYENSIIVDNYALENGISQTSGSGAGIIVYGESVVRGNKVIGNAFAGIQSGSGNGVITGNATMANGSYGIRSSSGSAEITDNLVNGNGSTGIWTSEGATIARNIITGNASTGIYAGEGSSVFDNAIYGNGDSGVAALSGASIQRNSVRMNGYRGLSLQSDSVYRENRITINGAGNVNSGLNMGDNACDNATTCP